jgi:Protein of unknown function (DUF3108)
MGALPAAAEVHPPGRSPRGMPRVAWLALVPAVLAAHVSLLQTAIGAWHLREAATTRPFTTRLLAPPPAAVLAVPSVAPAATPVRARPSRVQSEAARAPLPEPVAPPPAVVDNSFESNTALAHVDSTFIATNTVANNTQPPADAEGPAVEAPASRPDPEGVAAPVVPSEPPARPAPPVTVPAALRLAYTVNGEARRVPYSAQGVLMFRHDGQVYEARAEISAFLFGARVQTSTGGLTPQGLAPARFADKWRNERAVHFDRERGRITFSANTPEAPLLPGAQDRLSVLMQLGALLAGAPARYPAGASITLQTAGPRDAEDWQFTVAGPETLTLPSGETATVKLSRAPRREFDQRVEVWLAPALGYLPARLRITQANGDFVDQQLQASGPP